MNTVRIKQNITMVLLGIFAITVTGCAEYTVKEKPDDAMQSATTEAGEKPMDMPMGAQTHSKVEALAAINAANTAAKRAEELGGLWRDTTKLMKKARAALEKNDNDKAYKMAEIAKNQAELALNQSYLEKANHMIGRVKQMIGKDDMKMLDRVTEAEAAYLNDNGEKSYAMSVAMMEDNGTSPKGHMAKAAPMEMKQMAPAASMSEPEVIESAASGKEDEAAAMEIAAMESSVQSPEMGSAPSAVDVGVTRSDSMDFDDQYKVVSGDSLWGISAKPAVYSNPYQWPLIYKTNRKTIRDPDLIRPGQMLNIDREVSEADINAAVAHAKSRGAWSLGEKESHDQAYLSGDDMATR